jgi:hypothetical protein
MQDRCVAKTLNGVARFVPVQARKPKTQAAALLRMGCKGVRRQETHAAIRRVRLDGFKHRRSAKGRPIGEPAVRNIEFDRIREFFPQQNAERVPPLHIDFSRLADMAPQLSRTNEIGDCELGEGVSLAIDPPARLAMDFTMDFDAATKPIRNADRRSLDIDPI